MTRKGIIIGIVVITIVGFFTWRFIRPMNVFIVENKIAFPIDTSQAPPEIGNLSAEGCGSCHTEFYEEWKTTIHSQAWTDPYFQADWKFDDKQHICRFCHTPLDRQQPHRVLGYRDENKWDPILEDNPDFDAKLQHEGVTCTACHLREGKIVGVLGNTNAPHAVKKLDDPNKVCVRCHVVKAEKWGVFARFPPCGTVAEIERTQGNKPPVDDIGASGEVKVPDTQSLGCVNCHMPAVERPLIVGGKVRPTRQHLWRGGHDPEMVKKALTASFVESVDSKDQSRYMLTLTNSGAAHYFPTGTPDRHLTVKLRVLNGQGQVIEEKNETLKRTVIWRPFIIDLWDTRLQRWKPQTYQLDVPSKADVAAVEAVVSYHLLEERRRKRIAYENKEPISYEIFRKKIFIK